MEKKQMSVWPGTPYPLGATWDSEGVNFSLFSENAKKTERCLFDVKGRREIKRIDLRYQTDLIWHCYLPDAHPGLLFGYRVGNPREYLVRDQRNSAANKPKCRVVDSAFTWGDDRPSRTPWYDTVIYELHVKGFTCQHPEVPPLAMVVFRRKDND